MGKQSNVHRLLMNVICTWLCFEHKFNPITIMLASQIDIPWQQRYTTTQNVKESTESVFAIRMMIASSFYYGLRTGYLQPVSCGCTGGIAKGDGDGQEVKYHLVQPHNRGICNILI